MSEVGTAYVRIRPQTSTFRAETQHGVKSAFSGIGKVVIPTLAFVGVTEGLRKAVEAAQVKQVISGQLEVATRAAGLNYSELAHSIEETVNANRRLGFSEEETARSLTIGIRATRDVGAAQRLLSIATNVARGRNIGLGVATLAVVKAQQGQTASLRRLGVVLDKHATGVQAVAQAEKQFAGASDKYAKTATGSQERLSQSVERTAATVGEILLPAITRTNVVVADWLDNEEHQKDIQELVNSTFAAARPLIEGVTTAYTLLAPPVRVISDLFGGLADVGGKAIAIGALLGARKVVNSFKQVSTEAAVAERGIVSGSADGAKSLGQLSVAADKAAGSFAPARLEAQSTAAATLTIGSAAEETATRVVSSAAQMEGAYRAVALAAETSGKAALPSALASAVRPLVIPVDSDALASDFGDVSTAADDAAESMIGVAGNATTAVAEARRLSLAYRGLADGTADSAHQATTAVKAQAATVASAAATEVTSLGKVAAANAAVIKTYTGAEVAAMRAARAEKERADNAAYLASSRARTQAAPAATSFKSYSGQGMVDYENQQAGRVLTTDKALLAIEQKLNTAQRDLSAAFMARNAAWETAQHTQSELAYMQLGLHDREVAAAGAAMAAAQQEKTAYIGSMMKKKAAADSATASVSAVGTAAKVAAEEVTVAGAAAATSLNQVASKAAPTRLAVYGIGLAGTDAGKLVYSGASVGTAALKAEEVQAGKTGLALKLMGAGMTASIGGIAAGRAAKTGAGSLLTGAKQAIPATLGKALNVYIVDQLVSAFTGVDPLALAFKALRVPTSAIHDATNATLSLGDAMKSVPAADLARDQATLNAETAKATVISLSGAKGTLKYKSAVLQLRAAREQARISEDAYTDSLKAEAAEAGKLHDALVKFQTAPNEGAKDRFGFGVTLPGSRQVNALLQRTGIGAFTEHDKDLRTFTQEFAKFIGMNHELDPVLRHNLDLMLEFARTIGRVPTQHETNIILRNRDATKALDEILKHMQWLGRQSGVVADEIENNFGQAFRAAANTARERFDQAIPTLPQRGRGAQSQLAIAAAESHPGNVAAIRAAAENRLKVLEDEQKFWENRKPITVKALDRQKDQLTAIYGEEASIRGQIKSIDDDAAAKRKAASDAAAAKRKREREAAKRRAAKELAAYRDASSDELASLQRQATVARRSATASAKAAGAGGNEATFRAVESKVTVKDDALVAFYKRESHDSKLSKATRRHYAALALSTKRQEVTDMQSFEAAFRKVAEDEASVAVKTADAALAEADRSLPQIVRAQKVDQAALRKRLAAEIASAHDLQLSAEQRRAARARVQVTRKQIAENARKFDTQDRDLRIQELQLNVQAAQNAVSAAGSNVERAKSATEKEKIALRRLIKIERAGYANKKLSLQDRLRYRQQALSDEAALVGLMKDTSAAGNGTTLAELFSSAAGEFKTYGSNIGPVGTPLSPQDERASFAKAILHAARGGKKKQPPVVIQNFHGQGTDPYAAMRSAKQAAEHFYVGS